MENFNEKCLRYRTDLSNDALALEQHMEQVLNSYDFREIEQWTRAHCLCVVAANIGATNPLLFEIYNKLNEQSSVIHSATRLNDLDYSQWFESVRLLNELFIELGHYRAYYFQSELYTHARKGYSDAERVYSLLCEGIAKEDEMCLALGAYESYFTNTRFEHNKELALENLRAYYAKDSNWEVGMMLLNLLYRQCNSEQEVLDLFQEFQSLFDQGCGLYIKADYFKRMGDVQQVVDCLLRGIEHHSYSCHYLMGNYILDGTLEELGYTDEQGQAYLETAFYFGVFEAAYSLGLMYLRKYTGTMDLEYAVQWLERGVQYNSFNATFEVSKLYLYNSTLNTNSELQAKGVSYLEYLVEKEQAYAMAELASYYLERQSQEHLLSQAYDLLVKATELGSSFAVYRLGYAYENGEFGQEPDYQRAFTQYQQAADMGDYYGVQQAVRCLRNGIGVEVDFIKAHEYGKIGIEELDSDYCRTEIASMYMYGEGVEYDLHYAVELLEQAFENGYVYAGVRLGNIYEDEDLGLFDEGKAVHYFTRASEAGSMEGTYALAYCYLYGNSAVDVDVDKAKELYLLSEELGSMDAKVDLGLLYERGGGSTEVNPIKAFEYMQQAAQYGIPYAQYKLAVYYLDGIGVESDVNLSLQWGQQALDNNLTMAATFLGDLYLYDYLPGSDYAKAFNYYDLAAQSKYITTGYGVCFQYGLGVEKDEPRALEIYKECSEGDNRDATFRVGQCYFYGIGTEENYPQAFEYFSAAFEMGSIASAGFLGNMYLKGQGVEVDAEKGVEYLTIAANDNDPHAQYELGNCYLKGEGVDQDDEQALFWYQQAAANGNEAAQKVVGGPRRRRR